MNISSKLKEIREKMRHAFKIPDENEPYSEKDIELIGKIAKVIVDRRMGGPAILFLEGLKPLNFVGSQALVFLSPYLKMIIKKQNEMKQFEEILERRNSIATLINKIIEIQNKREGE